MENRNRVIRRLAIYADVSHFLGVIYLPGFVHADVSAVMRQGECVRENREKRDEAEARLEYFSDKIAFELDFFVMNASILWAGLISRHLCHSPRRV